MDVASKLCTVFAKHPLKQGGALFCRYFCVPLDGIKKPKSGNGKEIQGEQCSPGIRWEGGRCIAVCCYSFVMIQLHEYRH